MAGSTFERMEKKTIIRTEDLPLIRARIEEQMEHDPFNRDGAPYMISNLYFDDDADHVIRTSVTKPWYKEKLRLRSYGVPNDDTKVFLEIKKKCNKVGTKRRAKIPLRDVKAYLETGVHPTGLSYMDEQVLREIDYYRSHETVYPKIYVSYMRHAYFAKDDPDFRVTFDSDIVTRRYDLALELGRYGDPILEPGHTLMEVKFAGAVPLWFTRVMSDFGLSFHTFSKVGTDFKLYTYNKAIRQDPDGEHYLRLIH